MKIPAITWAAASLMVSLLPVALDGQGRGKIVDVHKPKPPTYEFPARFDGKLTQVEKYEDESSTLGKVWEILTTTANLTWLPQDAVPNAPGDPNDVGDLPGLPTFGKGVKSRTYKPSAGLITLHYSRQSTTAVGGCRSDNTVDFSVSNLPRSAFDAFTLEVGDNGKYKLNLNLPNDILAMTITTTCKVLKREVPKVEAPLKDTRIVLGHQEGSIKYGVTGETKTPISIGQFKVTGTWSFAAVNNR